MKRKINFPELTREEALTLAEEIKSQILENGAVTHNGLWHSDDVFSTALIMILCGNDIKINRERLTVEDSRFAYDTGNGNFDHHRDYEYRNPKTKEGIYAAFGKLWAVIGRYLLKDIKLIEIAELLWKEFDNQVASVIDYTDNTGEMNPLSYLLNQTRGKNLEESFKEAVKVAKRFIQGWLDTQISSANSTIEILSTRKDQYVESIASNVLNKVLLSKIGVKYIVSHDPIKDTTVVISTDGSALKLKSREDCIFTHKNGFMSVYPGKIGISEVKETIIEG